MNKVNKLRENSKRQFSELRNKINEQKEHFTKEIKTLRKNQSLELKKSVNEMKNALGVEQAMEERISELKERNLEKIQVEKER